MFYQLGRHVFIRNINHSLFLWDKFNDNKIFGDEVAFVFVKNITYQPKSFECIVDDIASDFSEDTDRLQIQRDAKTFFDQLEVAGLIFSGESEKKCMQKSSVCNFGSYSSVHPAVSDSHYDELVTMLKTPTLTQVMIEITKVCNERCVHCYIPHEKKKGFISCEDFTEIIRQCKEIRTVVDFKISGGECMTHPNFKSIIRQVKDEGFSLTLLTNLTLLDDEVIDILKEGTLSTVQVSMFSADSNIHDVITTKPGSLALTLQNLQKLKQAGIPVSISTQIMELNKTSIEGLYEFCKENGFRFLCDWTIVAREDRTTDNLDYRVEDISCYEKLCQIRLHHDHAYLEEMESLLALPLKAANTHLCNAGMNCLQIDADLDIHPCPGWDLNIGNLRNISIQQVWSSSPVLSDIRQTVLADFPKCAICENRNICHICMAEAYNESNGKYEMPEYECKVTEMIHKAIANQ